MRNLKARGTALDVGQFFSKPKPSIQEKSSKAELLLTAFMAEHNTFWQELGLHCDDLGHFPDGDHLHSGSNCYKLKTLDC